jgi:hypothetical protein
MIRTPLLLVGALSTLAAAQNPAVLLLDAGSPIVQDSHDTRAIRPADIDGDGDTDLFVGNFHQNDFVYRNMGNGTWFVVPPFNLTDNLDDTFDAAWGDMDADGDLDLAVANGSKGLQPGGGAGTNNALYRNIGPLPGTEGRFEPVTSGPVVSDLGETYAVAWADFNGDATQDLVFVNRLQPDFLYLNDGTGQFSKVTTGPLVTDDDISRDVATGDLDGDGDEDIVVANSNGEACAIYLNQGHAQGGVEGEFARDLSGPLATDTGDAYGVTIADYDGDAVPDVFVTRRYGQGNMLYRNSGGASFTRMTALAPSQDAGDSYESAWGDLDVDGDRDLVVANRDEDNFQYLGDGDGTFTKVTWGQVANGGGDSRGAAIADMDGDGWPEVMFANTLGGADFYYRNHGPTWTDLGYGQGSGPELPRLAGAGWLAPSTPVDYLVTHAPVGQPAILVASLTAIFAPFKGGTLVPAPDIVVAGFAGDLSGEITFAVTFPATPVPSGLSLYHQMWMQDPGSPTGFCATNAVKALTP